MYAKFIVLKSRLRLTDDGASMVEYALLVVLIAICGFVAVSYFGDTVSDTYGDIGQSLVNANQ